MNVRVGHVTDVRDTRPTFQLIYRKYSGVSPGCFVAQADRAEDAVGALQEHLGTWQFVVISLRII